MDMIHGEIRQYELMFKSDIFKILKENNILMPYVEWGINISSEYEDSNLSYDMIINGRVELSVRIRKNKYLKYRDFTIRSRSLNEQKCEIDKIEGGLGKIYFYGWMDESESKIDEYIVVDIEQVRGKLKNNGVIKTNTDNTQFRAYPIDWLREHKSIIKSSFKL